MSNVQLGYGWDNAEHTNAHSYLLPVILKEVEQLARGRRLRILDLGCGNGAVTGALAAAGHAVIGADASADGIEIARRSHPDATFELCSVYDDRLARIVGQPVDCVVAVEVIEHLYFPKRLFQQALAVLQPGGRLVVTTPYHGYLKNLALSLTNAWDRHVDVNWDGGHIKFFSRRTLEGMASAHGLSVLKFLGAGRLPGLWKSMILVAARPPVTN